MSLINVWMGGGCGGGAVVARWLNYLAKDAIVVNVQAHPIQIPFAKAILN